MLKNGFIKRLNNLPNIKGMLVHESSSVATKKGKRVGTIEVDHKLRPDFVAFKFDDENNTKHIVKTKNKVGKIFFLIKLILFSSFLKVSILIYMFILKL